MLLAIDSGKDLGWAYFDDARCLVSCGLRGPLPAFPPGTRVIIERPHEHRTKARVRDIITLAIRAGEVGGVLREYGAKVEYVEPSKWKLGPIPKDIMNKRVLRALRDSEMSVVRGAINCPKGKFHNVLDAVGIGLWGTKRLG